LIVHLRKKSVGGQSLSNTQPFRHGKWSFSHNGTIFNSRSIPLNKSSRNRLRGETDSERLFRYILQLAQKPNVTAREAIMQAISWVKGQLDYAAMNLIVSDGQLLWATREFNEKNPTVKGLALKNYYTLYLNAGPRGAVVSSERLRAVSGTWHLLPNHSGVEIEFESGKVSAFKLP
jgi:predicted glutamine amidotransferase